MYYEIDIFHYPSSKFYAQISKKRCKPGLLILLVSQKSIMNRKQKKMFCCYFWNYDQFKIGFFSPRETIYYLWISLKAFGLRWTAGNAPPTEQILVQQLYGYTVFNRSELALNGEILEDPLTQRLSEWCIVKMLCCEDAIIIILLKLLKNLRFL